MNWIPNETKLVCVRQEPWMHTWSDGRKSPPKFNTPKYLQQYVYDGNNGNGAIYLVGFNENNQLGQRFCYKQHNFRPLEDLLAETKGVQENVLDKFLTPELEPA